MGRAVRYQEILRKVAIADEKFAVGDRQFGEAGKGQVKAIAKFATAYTDQNERDYRELVDAVKSGRITAEPGL